MHSLHLVGGMNTALFQRWGEARLWGLEMMLFYLFSPESGSGNTVPAALIS